MIYTLTLNAAIDMTILSPQLVKNGVTRADNSNFTPNGKGVNVSLILSHFNIPNTAVAVLGGFTGDYIYKELSKICCIKPVFVDEDTRLNVFINQGDHEYKIVSKGAFVSDEKQDEVLKTLKEANDLELLVVSGSLPPGINESFFFEIIDVCKNKGIDFVFDISSPVLKDILPYKPYLIKPNDDELKEIFGLKLEDEKDIINALITINKMGAQNIMLTLGDKGMYVFHSNKIYFANAVNVKLVSSACAGDSSLASFLSLEKTNIKEAMILASAVGADVAGSEGIGDLNRVELFKQQVTIREVSYE